jgi:hypothetical protein
MTLTSVARAVPAATIKAATVITKSLQLMNLAVIDVFSRLMELLLLSGFSFLADNLELSEVIQR